MFMDTGIVIGAYIHFFFSFLSLIFCYKSIYMLFLDYSYQEFYTTITILLTLILSIIGYQELFV
jgi:hypothetical protein